MVRKITRLCSACSFASARSSRHCLSSCSHCRSPATSSALAPPAAAAAAACACSRAALLASSLAATVSLRNRTQTIAELMHSALYLAHISNKRLYTGSLQLRTENNVSMLL